MIRIGVDTGGTFTDVVCYDAEAGRTEVVKVPSTPPEFEAGVLSGIDSVLDGDDSTRDPGAVEFLSHGTTVATNAVLEGELEEIGLVTNEGLADVLAIGDQTRPALYDLQAEKPDPPVARRHRKGVPGRLDDRGDVVEPLDEESVEAVAAEFVEAGIETVAVSTLFSFLNPDHEDRIAGILEDHGIEAVRSSEVHPEIREYERTVTTALNAAVRGSLSTYLDRLSAGVTDRGIEPPVNVMHSGGGLFSTAGATRQAVRTVLSGPAAGGVAAREVARREGYDDAVGMDVGGTSADVTVVRDGDLERTTETEVGGLPLITRSVDVTTVGAGGGSVVRVDRGGALRVGPESAGADPGPVCYGRGGDRPTLTDANLLLGRIHPDAFLGGEMDLAVERARSVFERDVADPLGESIEAAALATVRVANAGLARELRRVTVERGRDPESFALVAFGGGGPLQAAAVAREVGATPVVVPPTPGVFSARGLLLADVRLDESRSYRGPLDPDPVEAAFDALADRLRDRLARQGFDPDRADLSFAADLRYRGQSYELSVDAHPGEEEWIDRVRDRFHRGHRDRYGHATREEPVEAVTLRATGQVTTPDPEPDAGRADGEAHRGTTEVRFESGTHETDRYRRRALSPGREVEGPAILEEPGSTTLVPPETDARIVQTGNLVIER